MIQTGSYASHAHTSRLTSLKQHRQPEQKLSAAPPESEATRSTELPRFGGFTMPVLSKKPLFGAITNGPVLINNLDPDSDDFVIQRQLALYPDLVEANAIRKKCIEQIKKAGLKPFDVNFYAVPEEPLLETAARNGFSQRYTHWSWGQDYFVKFKFPRLKGLMPFLEVVSPGNPLKVLLLDTDPNYAKKSLMMQALARSDFHRNNIHHINLTKHLNMQHLPSLIADNARRIDNYGQELANTLSKSDHAKPAEVLSEETGISAPLIEAYRAGKMTALEVGHEAVEAFLDKCHSIRNLIDNSTQKVRNISEIPIPDRSAPEPDILGFIVKASPDLKSWQKDILGIIRSESYILLPQARTQIMADGWATHWNRKLNVEKPIMWDVPNLTLESAWGANRFLPDQLKLNTYQLGYEMFRSIENNLKQKFANDPSKENKIQAEMQRIRRLYYDASFIRDFLTKETVNALMLYNYDADDQSTDGQDPGTKLRISDKDFEPIRDRLIEMFENAGQPVIQVLDPDYNNKGELLLQHVYAYDLRQDYAQKTLLNLALMWGKPVYLETYKTEEDGSKSPIRIYSNGVTMSELPGHSKPPAPKVPVQGGGQP